MFLSDPETFNNFDIDGALFQTYVNKPGLHYFDVKMKIKKNLEDDPKVLCKIYNQSESYAEVEQTHKTYSRCGIEWEMILKFLALFLDKT